VSGQRGFTLIELLAALAVLAVLSLVLAGGLRIGSGALARAEERSADLEALRLAQGFLRARLETAEPLAWASERRAVTAFAGEPDAVSFVALLPAHLGGGAGEVRFSVERGRLWMTWRPLPHGATDFDFAGAERRALLDLPGLPAFDYYGARELGSAPEWGNRWDGTLGLPRLVRLSAGAGWPELTVAPRLERSDR